MAKTKSDVEKLQDEVAKLREELAKEETKAAEVTQKTNDDIVVAQLEGEKARLQAQLQAAKAQSAPTASAPLEAMRQQVELANAQRQAAEELTQTDKEA